MVRENVSTDHLRKCVPGVLMPGVYVEIYVRSLCQNMCPEFVSKYVSGVCLKSCTRNFIEQVVGCGLTICIVPLLHSARSHDSRFGVGGSLEALVDFESIVLDLPVWVHMAFLRLHVDILFVIDRNVSHDIVKCFAIDCRLRYYTGYALCHRPPPHCMD